LAAPAQAQEPGVTIDPNSPAGAEYALPLDDARDTGAGGPRSSGQDSPTFGVGIERPQGAQGNAGSGGAAAGDGGSAGDEGSATESGSRSTERSANTETSPSAKRPPSASLAATPQGGTGSSFMVAGGAAMVVLAGTLLGLVVRRRRVRLGGPR
jgi:hypothetical protein